MQPLAASSTTALVIVNVLLGLLCASAIVLVAFAAYRDVRERRSWKRLVPPCWPPPGVDPSEAYATPDALLRTPAPGPAARPTTPETH